MSLDPYIREQVAWQVIAVLVKRFQTFPEAGAENRNAPFHEAFLRAFTDRLAPYVTETGVLISLSSWLHGLNTSLGASFFEKTAHALSGGEKRTFKAGELTITSAQAEAIEAIVSGLKMAPVCPLARRKTTSCVVLHTKERNALPIVLLPTCSSKNLKNAKSSP